MQMSRMTTQSLVFGCAASLFHAYLFPSESLCAGACNCNVQPWLCPPAGGDHEMGAIYPGACQVVVTIYLEPEGGKCHGVMCMNRKYASNKSRIPQAVQLRPQPSESCVPMSPLPAMLTSFRWDGSHCLQRLFTSGCP